LYEARNRSVSVNNKTLEQARRELSRLPEELIQLATNLVANNPQDRPSLENVHKLLWTLFFKPLINLKLNSAWIRSITILFSFLCDSFISPFFLSFFLS
jgi:hypothetical protein